MRFPVLLTLLAIALLTSAHSGLLLKGKISKPWEAFFHTTINGLLKTCPASFRAVVLKLEHASESPGGLVKTQIAGPHP